MYTLTEGQKLSLLRFGMEYQDLQDMEFPSKGHYTSISATWRRSCAMLLQKTGRHPASGIDKYLLAMFDYNITFADEALPAWAKVQKQYGFQFPLQYLVHSELNYHFPASQNHDAGQQWKTVLLQYKIKTRKDMIKAYITARGFLYQKLGGLKLPVTKDTVPGRKIRNHTYLAALETSRCPYFKHTDEHIEQILQDLKYQHPSLRRIDDYCLPPCCPIDTGSPIYYIYCIAPTEHPSCQPIPVYVGQTLDLHGRMQAHLRNPPKKVRRYLAKKERCSHNEIPQGAIARHLKLYLLDFTDRKTISDDLESYYISYYDSYDRGFNTLVSNPATLADAANNNKKFWAFIRQKRRP